HAGGREKLVAVVRDFTISPRGPRGGARASRKDCFQASNRSAARLSPWGVPCMTDDSSETNRLLRQAAEGDPEQFGARLEEYRPRLRRMVALRLDPRLHGRVDPSDGIHGAYLEASAPPAHSPPHPALP